MFVSSHFLGSLMSAGHFSRRLPTGVVALLLVIRGVNDGLAVERGWVFLISRVLYVPAYLAGMFGVRSAIWVVSWAGLVMMIIALMRAF